MIHEEFLTTLKMLNVKENGGEFRIKGFLLDYINSPIMGYVLLKGKIPYFLAKVIYEQADKYGLDTFDLNFTCEDKEHPVGKVFIKQIKLGTSEALKYVIETIRDYPFINEWAIGNY